ncbi:LysR family transcriptional regulator [Paraburkholderia unamae]|uniref:LysR family transcriptional regulator n=1 Tax=Paraburkholderia unamae TaxID=219649 RepID=UPI000E30454E
MDRLHAMTVFVRVVESGSFTRASELLGLSRASVTIAVQQLESYLKVRLLQRTTRQLKLTPDGAAYFERCVRILTDIDEAEGGFDAKATRPRGRLRVDMPTALGRAVVMPRIHEFCAQYPDIDLVLGFGDRRVDLIQEGIDCVIRVGELEDSTLVARKIGIYQQITVASPLYLRRHGTPESIGDLARHHAANYFSHCTGRVCGLNFVVGERIEEVYMTSDVAVNDVDAHLQGALDGMGIIQSARFLTLPYLQSGRLREILPDFPAPTMPISMVYPTSRHLSLTVRVFVDWTAALFRSHALLAPAPATREEPDVAARVAESESAPQADVSAMRNATSRYAPVQDANAAMASFCAS